MSRRYTTAVIFIFILVFLLSSGPKISAGDRLINAPTAELKGEAGFLAGDTDGEGYGMRGMLNLSPWLGVGAGYDGYEPELQAHMIFVSEERNRPGIASGVRGEDIYLVFSKGISYGFSGHVGYGNGTMNGPFLGVRKTLNPVSYSEKEDGFSLPPMDLVGEYYSGDINLGAEMRVNSSLSINLAVEDFSGLKGGFSVGF